MVVLPTEGKLLLKVRVPLPVRVARFVDPLLTRTATVSVPLATLLTVVVAEPALKVIVELVPATDRSGVL